MIYSLRLWGFGALTLLLLTQCARIMSPEGGPKDVTPPRIVKEDPPNGSTSVQAKRIKISFKEFIKLNDASKSIVISPPMGNQVTPIIRGKSIIINLPDSLAKNTTYTLQFGNSIGDITENNRLDGYVYTFSTGDKIDQCELYGTIQDAFTLEPVASATVMLYRGNADSLVTKGSPDFVTKSNADGNFKFKNLPCMPFKLVALEDKNQNLKYEGTEKFAYADTMISSHPNVADTTKADPISPVSINLRAFLFHQKPTRLLKSNRPTREKLTLQFSTEPVDSIRFETLAHAPFRVIADRPPKSADPIFWLSDSLQSRQDSLTLLVSYKATDSLQQLTWRTDTLYFNVPESILAQEQDTTSEEPKPIRDSAFSLSLSLIRTKLYAQPDDSILLTSAMLPLSFDSSRVTVRNADSAILPRRVVPMPGEVTKFAIIGNWPERNEIVIEVPANCMHDIYGRPNASKRIKYGTVNPSKFSAIHIHQKDLPTNALVQIYDPSDREKKTISQGILSQGDSILSLKYLKPGEYAIRVVEDHNRNNAWDPGDYINGVQPERVWYYRDATGKNSIAVRANWEYDIDVSRDNLTDNP